MIRYYPSFRIIENLNTTGNEFLLDGKPYSGKYYETYDGRAFTGARPEDNLNKPLKRLLNFSSAPGLSRSNLPDFSKIQLAINTNISSTRIPGRPNSFYPQPTEEDYRRGYIIRYFTKKENERGFITEIDRDQYNDIVNGTADYDTTIYQVTTILWKLTGPLRNKRESQYNIIPGIVDTNERLTIAADKNFLGIVEWIGGDYAKYARPTL